MATKPFTVDRFGGLNIYEDPQEVGAAAAVDLLNVDVDQRGRVRSRDGSVALTSAAANNQTTMAYYKDSGGVEYILANDTTTLRPYALSNGAAGSTQAALTNSNNAFARFGDTSNTRLYVAGGGLFRLTSTTWATVGGLPVAPSLLAVTPNDNRLVMSTIVDSRVWFSDVSTPETVAADNFVDLWPGDGESIAAMSRWRDYLFVFKSTKFAVFTGTSVDADGGAIFNYRAVDTGRGVVAPGQAVAGQEGVYFVDAGGIFLTTGDTPRYISRAVEPWLRAGSFGSLPAISLSTVTLAYHDRRLYVVYPNGTSSVTLVYDPALDAWLVWQAGMTAVASVPASSQYRGLYFGEFTSKKVAKVDATVSTDQGAAVSWSYTSGAYDLSGENRVAVTLESALWGTGAATLKVANDHASFDTGSAVTLGTSPAVAQGWQQIDREGVYWQHKLSGATAAVVNRLVHYVSFVKPAGVG